MQSTPVSGSASSVLSCAQVADVLLLLDLSSSLQESGTAQMFDFVDRYVQQQSISASQIKLGVITFNDNAELLQPLTDNPLELVNLSPQSARLTNGTNITAALEAAEDEFIQNGRDGVPHVILLFSDGEHVVEQPNVPHPSTVYNRLGNEGIHVFAVGLGNHGMTLEQISDEVLSVGDVALLSPNLQAISDQACEWIASVAPSTVLVGSQPAATSLPASVATAQGSTGSSSVGVASSWLPVHVQAGLQDYWWLLLLPVLLLLLLIAFLSRRARSSSHSGGGGETSPNANEIEEGPKMPTDTWFDNLKKNTIPDFARVVTPIHNPTLIVGLGGLGRQVLDQLVLRMDATQSSHFLADNPPSVTLLHLDVPLPRAEVPLADPNPAMGIITSIALNAPQLPRPANDIPAALQWLATLNLRNVNNGRHYARAALFEHFALLGGNAPLAMWLQNLHPQINNVIIVADTAALDGGNIASDVATLIKAVRPNANIDHLILKQSALVPAAGNSAARLSTLATLIETNRFRNPQPWYRYHFGPDFHGNIEGQIVRQVTVVGDEASSPVDLSNFVWVLLTAPAVADAFRENMVLHANQNHPAVDNTLTFNYARTQFFYPPLTLMREIMVLKLVLLCVGDNGGAQRGAPLNPPTADLVDARLNQTRQSGINTQLTALKGAIPAPSPWLTQFHTAIQEYQRATKDKLLELEAELNNHEQALRAHLVITPEDARLVWERIGLKSTNPYNGQLGYAIAQMAPNTPAQFVNAAVTAVAFTQKIEEVARRFAHNKLVNQFTVPGAALSDRLQPQRLQIDNTAQQHTTTVPIQGPPYALDPAVAMVNLPTFGNATTIHQPGGDQLLSASIVFVSNIPIRCLQVMPPAPNRQIKFIHEEDGIAMQVYENNLEDVLNLPTSLRSALKYKQPMWNLYRVYHQCGMNALRDLIPDVFPEDDGVPVAWENVVREFIGAHANPYFQVRIDKALAHPIAHPAPLADDPNAARYQRALFGAFRYFNEIEQNPPLQPGYYPPK